METNKKETKMITKILGGLGGLLIIIGLFAITFFVGQHNGENKAEQKFKNEQQRGEYIKKNLGFAVKNIKSDIEYKEGQISALEKAKASYEREIKRSSDLEEEKTNKKKLKSTNDNIKALKDEINRAKKTKNAIMDEYKPVLESAKKDWTNEDKTFKILEDAKKNYDRQLKSHPQDDEVKENRDDIKEQISKMNKDTVPNSFQRAITGADGNHR